MACTVGDDYCAYQGDTFSSTITVTDGTNPIDITNYTITFVVASSLGSATQVINKNVTISDGPNGVAVLQLTETDTGVDAFNYYYDLEFRNNDSSLVQTIQGRFEVKSDIA